MIQAIDTVRLKRTIGELKSLLDRLPRLGKEAEAFEKDIDYIRDHQPMSGQGFLKKAFP